MIGPLYAGALGRIGGTGKAGTPDDAAGDLVVESADGRMTVLPVAGWDAGRPGDDSLLERCRGPVLDAGSGPGRLTAALAGRGVPVLGVDITRQAVEMTRRRGGLALQRDLFGHLPGTGRWPTVLLVDGNIGIGGDAPALLTRVAQLLAWDGRILAEVEPPGRPSGRERVRLRSGDRVGPWFRWAYVSVDDVDVVAGEAGLVVPERWSMGDRWFVAMAHG